MLLEKSNKIVKTRLTKKKERRNTFLKSEIKAEIITTNITKITSIMKEYYKQFYSDTLDNLDETDKSLKRANYQNSMKRSRKSEWDYNK